MENKINEYLKELEKHNNAGKIEICQKIYGADYNKRYIKIWEAYKNNQNGKSVFCFIDYDGNIYKPAGWNAPAKGIRATIESPVYFMHELYKTYKY